MAPVWRYDRSAVSLAIAPASCNRGDSASTIGQNLSHPQMTCRSQIPHNRHDPLPKHVRADQVLSATGVAESPALGCPQFARADDLRKLLLSQEPGNPFSLSAWGDTMAQEETTGNRLASDASPVICLEEFLDRCMGNLTFAVRAIARFRQDFAVGLTELRQAIESAASSQIAAIAHRLKGAAAVVAAHRLRQLTEDIERLGRAGAQEQLPVRLQELEGEWSRFLEHRLPLAQDSVT